MKAWAVQISDLHVGGNIQGGGLLPKATAHDLRALRALNSFFKQFQADHACERTALIVCGDVSANGGDAELGMYRTLVERGFELSRWEPIEAFRSRFNEFLEIPGNHDFWDGWPVPNPALSAMRADHFIDPPWNTELALKSHRVVFHGLCSTGGCTAGEQVLAFGAFEKTDREHARRSISAASGAQQAEPFHLLVLHHSAADKSLLSHRLTDRACADLTNLCHLQGRERVRGLLTGHRHSCLIAPASPSQDGSGRLLPPEVRCGTTIQAPAPGFTQPRALYVHEFDDASGNVQWHATPWSFNGRKLVPETRVKVV